MLGIVPLFKGDKAAPEGKHEIEVRQANEMLITGRNPTTRQPLCGASYVELIRNAKPSNRELCENVARVFACALHAVMSRHANRYYVEGCTYYWGIMPRLGAEINESIDGIIPQEIRSKISPPVVYPYSNRTRKELEKVFKFGSERGDIVIDAVTHDYHRKRARRIGEYVKNKMGYPVNFLVKTPLEIVVERLNKYLTVQPSEQFLIDAIKAAEPWWRTRIKEGVTETLLLMPLNVVSRWAEVIMGKMGYDFDLEGYIADRKRGGKSAGTGRC